MFRNKVAMITGGGSGIGFTIAEMLMRHQCDTIIASRNVERLQLAARALETATGRHCLPLQLDVRSADDIDRVVRQALDRFKKIDILVNNAAGNFLCPLAALSPKGFRTVLDIDSVGTFAVSTAVYKACFEKQNAGVIINITSTLQRRGDAMMGHAAAAKAAIESLTRTCAVEWGGNGVRANCIAPGPVADTEGFAKLGGPAITEQWIRDSIPLRALSQRIDIANCALFLASDASRLVTGDVITVDGGHCLSAANSLSAVQSMAERFAGSKL